jgi:protein gp37
MCDNFEDHPTIIAELAKLWPLIRATPNLDWQLLTKRADRIASSLPDDWGAGYPNVWLGVSIESNDWVWRADRLREVPAAVRFVSYEPALGPLDKLDLTWLHWVIYGGESGKNRRPEDKQWARDMRDRCWASEPRVAFFHKQSSAIRTEMGIELDGQIIREFPTPRSTAVVTVQPPSKPVAERTKFGDDYGQKQKAMF